MTGLYYTFVQALQSSHGFSGQVLGFLLDVSLKGTVFLLLASGLTLVLRRASAAARHLVWTLALGMMLALPIASLTLPRWNLRVIPSPRAMPAPQLPEVAVVPSTYQLRSDRPAERANEPREAPPYARWPEWPVALYLAALAVLLARTAVGEMRVRALVRRSRVLEAGPVESALLRARLHLRVSRAVELRTSAETAVPFTCAALRPTIILPEEAREWHPKQLELVLVHELAHVSRRDCFTQQLAQAAGAMYWFHPLVWLAAFEMRKERERACDDVVLGLGHPATQYAECLLSLGRSLRAPDPLCPTSVAMAHSSNLEVRMKALFNGKLNHQPIATWRGLVAAAFAVALLVPAAAIHATAKNGFGSRESTRSLTADGASNRTVSMSGTVRDPSGAAIPGAQVTALNVETRHRITVQTRQDGSWQLPGLPAGRYRVEIAKPGFALFKEEGNMNRPRDYHTDAIMQLGQVTQIVTVSGHRAAETGPSAPKSSTPERIRVGGDVEAAKIVFQSQPVYPASAEKRGIQGTVVIQAVIGKDGNLLSLTPLSGPDHALIQAAMNAVRQWRYKPTLLNGAPVEVATTIEVEFQLDNQSGSVQVTSPPRAAQERLIRSIDYKGLNSVSQAELVNRFRQDHMGLYIMSQYEPVVLERAEVVIREMLSEHGRPDATVSVLIRDVPPDWVALTFVVQEGPKMRDPQIAQISRIQSA